MAPHSNEGLMPRLKHTICAALLGVSAVSALNVQFDDEASVKKAARTIADDMMTYYKGNLTGQTPGLLPHSGEAPNGYFWWEGGAMFGSLMDYWYFTGDKTYNDVTTEAMLFQVGDSDNYEPTNQSFDLGNDDQAFWAMSAMTGAEEKFPNPPKDKPQWLALAQAVFNRQVLRWDAKTCGGGLRWQFNQFNPGYTYKSTIANGCLMNLGARLGQYTGNQTYLDWAEKIYDWTHKIGLIDSDYNVFDGTSIEQQCKVMNRLQWTYNVGIFLQSAASMYNATKADKWKQETMGLLKGTDFFFENGVMVEKMCEAKGNCNTDQLSYKSYLMRWMAQVAKTAPFTADQINQKLQKSSQNAASVCKCGPSGTECSFSWKNPGACDGKYGIGQQMNALQAVQINLEDKVRGPVSQKTGGISKGDPGAGSSSDDGTNLGKLKSITTGDKAGAGILTTLVVLSILGGAVWMVL